MFALSVYPYAYDKSRTAERVLVCFSVVAKAKAILHVQVVRV
jgi:hypothetical protein